MSERPAPARPVGINHVAIEVGDLEAALTFYRDLLAFELRGRTESAAFVDIGDQFLAIVEGEDDTGADDHRHIGLVVDDPDRLAARLADSDADRLDGAGLDFRDPWGNRVQVVGYEDVQFTKAAHVLAGMGFDDLEKSAAAIAELEDKGIAPD